MRLLIALIALLAGCEDECRKLGGRRVSFNCRDEFVVVTMPDGNGGVLPMLMFQTNCDEKCQMPEASL